MATGDPVISVDTKKKELVGQLQKRWAGNGSPRVSRSAVKVHDFIDKQLGKAHPVRGLRHRRQHRVGHRRHRPRHRRVRGRHHPTWWRQAGTHAYPNASRLLITADGGGSNGYRTRLWKIELARLAAETGLTITVCHLPPGTSKWNKSA